MARKLKIEGELVAQSTEGRTFVVKTDEQNIVLSFKNWDTVVSLMRSRKVGFKQARKWLRYAKNLSQRVIFVVSGKVVFEIANGRISKPKLRELIKLYYHYLRGRKKK